MISDERVFTLWLAAGVLLGIALDGAAIYLGCLAWRRYTSTDRRC